MSTRRGGLGRGLGALIQSTVEPPAEDSTTASVTSETSVPARKEAGTAAKPSKGTGAASPKSAADKNASKTQPTAATTGDVSPVTEAGLSDDAAPRGEQSTEGKGAKGRKKPAAAKKTESASGRKHTTGEKNTSPSSPRRGQRPVDVFFSGGGTDEDDSTGTGSSRTTTQGRSGRPTMPTVKAPSGRRADTSSRTREAAVQETAEGVQARGESAAEAAASGERPAAPESAPGGVSADIAVLREIPVGDIHPNPRQPREVFDEDHMAELVTSIQEVGVLQPVVVREVDGPTPYELIMGERRWRATQRAGFATIPAIVRQTQDEDLLRDALLENLHRSQLNPLEEAAAYQQLMEDFDCTQEELSRRIGRSRPQISNTLRLLRLPPLVQRRVAAGTLSAGHARALLGLTDTAEMERLAQRIVTEGLSVRATEEAVAQLQGSLRAAPSPKRTREDTRHERLDYFANALTSRLDTQVKITLGARKGRIAIDFTSVEDLNRIMDLIQGEADAGR